MIGHFDDVSRQIEEDCIMANHRRWNNLSHKVKNREYHTPEILMGALEREPSYKRAMQTKKIQWLGVKLSPPLLLGLNDEKDTDAQDREWKNAEKNNGFYPLGKLPHLFLRKSGGLLNP